MKHLVDVAGAEASDYELRGRCLWAIGRLRPKGMIPVLTRVIATSTDARIANAAVAALVHVSSPVAVRTLLRVLVRGKSQVGRAEAAWGLGVLHARSAAAILIRIVAKTEEDAHVRAEAIEALGYINDLRAVEPLLRILSDRNPALRFEAILSLGNLGDRRALPAFAELHNDATEIAGLGQIRDAAAQASQTIEMISRSRRSRKLASRRKRGRNETARR